MPRARFQIKADSINKEHITGNKCPHDERRLQAAFELRFKLVGRCLIDEV